MPRYAAVVAAALLALPALPARAADLYDCRLTVQHNAVPEMLLVEIGAQGDSVMINDPVIRHVMGKPIAAEVAVDNARRTTFAWELTITNQANQRARVAYRLTVLKPSLTADIHAQALGYAGDLTGRGRCKRVSAPGKAKR